MAWSLASIVIHPGDEEMDELVEANYSIQKVLDASADVISYFGASSDHISLNFIMFESENASAGRTALKAAAKANANVNLTADTGSMGNYRILTLRLIRKLAANHSSPVYKGQAELIAS